MAVVLGALLIGGKRRPLSPDEYRRQLAAAFAGFEIDTTATDGSALQAFADQYHDLADELEDIVPPADAAPAHERLATGLEAFAREIDALAEAGRQGAIEYQMRLAESGGLPATGWLEAFNELAARGYLSAQPR